MGRLTVSLALLLIAGACARTPSAGEATPNTAASIPAVSSSAVTSAPAEQSSSAATAAPLVVIWFENRSYGQIIGNPCCPYINARASGGRRYVNYHAVTHPSLPNYLAFAGGSTCGKSSDGVLPYCTGRNLWDQLARAGIGWRVLQESMPSRCSLTNTAKYAVRHNPEAVYADQAGTAICAKHDVPLPDRISSLPPFTFVTPNICHDMHSCPASTGDRWLKRWLPKFLAVPRARVVITFDEGTSTNHIPAFEVGAGVPNATNRTSFSHYSLLAGVEERLGLRRLGNAATAIRLPV